MGTKPWRARKAEVALIGGPATAEAFARAASVELAEAQVREHNAFKLPFAQRAIARALTRAMEGTAR